MSVITKDLGVATAYGYANSKGYTGTEEEFAELMASYADVAQQAEAAAQDAEDAKGAAITAKTAAQTAQTAAESAQTAAAGSAQTASTKASEAAQSAQSAAGSASAAQASATAAAGSAQTAQAAAQTVTTKASEASSSASVASTAKTGAETARTGAQTAQTAAETAQANAEAAASSVSASAAQIEQNTEDITGLKNELSNIYEETPVAVRISDIPSVTACTGWNGGVGSASTISLSKLTSYNSYYFVTDTDCDVWFNTVTAGYLAVTVGEGYQSVSETSTSITITCTRNVVRYRKSDNNLPTVNSKLHIPNNSAVCFTITAGAMDSINGITTIAQVKETFKKEILPQKYFRYWTSTGTTPEGISVYIPDKASDGYVRYLFAHCVDASINSNIWRVSLAHHCNKDFSVDFALTTEGEWECAIKLSGRSDFSGGVIHGDEVMTGIVFLVDGSPVDITTYTNITPFDNLSVIQTSELYDPNDSTTVFAQHGSEHIFDFDGMRILQSVKFDVAETVATAYLAMLPISKAVSDTVAPNNTFAPLSTSEAIRIHDTDKVVIYKTNGTVKADFSVPKWDYLLPGDITFMCLDNGGSLYNKCYFVNCTSSPVNVAQGKLIKTETKYNFVVGMES